MSSFTAELHPRQINMALEMTHCIKLLRDTALMHKVERVGRHSMPTLSLHMYSHTCICSPTHEKVRWIFNFKKKKELKEGEKLEECK